MKTKLLNLNHSKKSVVFKSICGAAAAVTLAGVISSAAICSTTSTTTYTFNNAKSSTTSAVETSKYDQMKQIVQKVATVTGVNQNSVAFKNAFQSEMDTIISSKHNIETITSKKITDEEYNQLCSVVSKINENFLGKNNLNSSVKAFPKQNASLIEMSIKHPQHVIADCSFMVSKWQISNIINSAISSLTNLSGQLSTQKNALEGTAGTISAVLTILGFFDCGTTIIVAAVIGGIIGGVCGTLGSVISNINSCVSNMEANLNENINSLNFANSLSTIAAAMLSSIHSIQNAKSNLNSDTWVLGVNNAINELNTSINQLWSAYNQIESQINQLN